ncbi:MAG: PIN domain-containing protein [Gammaproteobacteria bacterium]|nr:PIN domain-containing protein [Gammaproteobacteria bacterium]
MSYWDALIIETALAADATVLLTEDLQHGQEFGRLRVTNPFPASDRG